MCQFPMLTSILNLPILVFTTSHCYILYVYVIWLRTTFHFIFLS